MNAKTKTPEISAEDNTSVISVVGNPNFDKENSAIVQDYDLFFEFDAEGTDQVFFLDGTSDIHYDNAEDNEKQGRKPDMEEGDHEILFEQAIYATRSMATYARKSVLTEQITALQNEAAKLRPPPLPDPDPTGKSYPVFVPRTGMNPIEHLRTQWGQWLMCFNGERPEGEKLDRNYLFRHQLLNSDPKLIPALESHLRRLSEKSSYFGMSPPDFISTEISEPVSNFCTCKII